MVGYDGIGYYKPEDDRSCESKRFPKIGRNVKISGLSLIDIDIGSTNDQGSSSSGGHSSSGSSHSNSKNKKIKD
jgi:hypothetical protein